MYKGDQQADSFISVLRQQALKSRVQRKTEKGINSANVTVLAPVYDLPPVRGMSDFLAPALAASRGSAAGLVSTDVLALSWSRALSTAVTHIHDNEHCCHTHPRQ